MSATARPKAEGSAPSVTLIRVISRLATSIAGMSEQNGTLQLTVKLRLVCLKSKVKPERLTLISNQTSQSKSIYFFVAIPKFAFQLDKVPTTNSNGP